MKNPHILSGLAATVLLGAPLSIAHAVICHNNIPPTNPDSAYVDHGDGTVTHIPSGLMWKRCAEGQTWDGTSCTGSASTHSWKAALDYAEAYAFAGHEDWRLPNVKELFSLVEKCRAIPAINDSVFPATPSSNFWSGAPNAGYSNTPWFVYFGWGHVGDDRVLPSGDSHIRLVRGGQ